MRIGTRLLIGNAILLAVLMATAYAAVSFYLNARKDRAMENALFFAQQIENQIESNIEFFRENMELFLYTTGLPEKGAANMDGAALSTMLRKRFITFYETYYRDKLYENVLVADPQGKVVACALEKRCPDVSDTAWWKQIEQGKRIVISGVTHHQEFNTLGLEIAMAFHDDEERLSGVISAFVATSHLIRRDRSMGTQFPSTVIELLSSDNKLLCASRAHTYNEDLSDEPYIRQMPGRGALETMVDGKRQLVVFKAFEGPGPAAQLGWRLVVRRDYDEILASAMQLRTALLFGTFVILLAAGIAFMLISRRITRRLRRLALAAVRLGQGNLQERAEIRGKDEIAELGRTFNTMAENLEAMTEELTQEVEERQRAEQSLIRETEKLVRSNKELEHFAYIASHDLQEPLRIIVSYLQLIVRRYSGKLDEDGQRFIDAAISGSERMRALIRGLLTYSRVSTKGKPFHTVSMDKVLEEAMTNLGEAIGETDATIEHAPLPTLYGDELQLVQLFQNLLGNAIKFQKEGVTPVVNVGVQEVAGEYCFSVQDNGIGMDREYAEHIFALFQRLHSRGRYEGTGIGLAVCKRIVERHGGRIWFNSEPGKGTTFYFTLSGREVNHAE